MILNPLMAIRLRPMVCTCIKELRSVRPTIKVAKEKFELSIDVHNFSKDEIRVKARPEYVLIQGKQERKTKNGYVVRHFARKFRLPEGCSPENMKTTLSPDGILTIKADRKICETNYPCESVIPISYTGSKKQNVSLIAPTTQDKCAMIKETPPDTSRKDNTKDEKK